MSDRLVRLSEVLQIVARSESSLRRDIRHGRFPAPVKIGPRAIAWRASEIDAHIAGLQTSEASNA